MANDTENVIQLPVVPEDEFAVYGTVYAFPQHADALEAVYRLTSIMSKSEPGILYYCISRDGDDPTIFHFFERYTGRKAFEAHNNLPIIQKLLKEDRYIKDVKAAIAKPLPNGA